MHLADIVLLCLLSFYTVRANYYSNNNQECCKCPDSGKDDSENSYIQIGSLTKEQQELLDLHNKYRRQVAEGKVPKQPGSSKIRDLKWNKELEASAQRHANKCLFQHDTAAERRTDEWNWVGQNIAYSSSIAKNVQMWFDEYKDFNYEYNYCYRVCGHYTQLVWANTTDVGCGINRCNFNGFNAVFVVCNYGPGGNWNNRKPY